MSEETVHEDETKRSRRGMATFLGRITRRLGRGENVPVNEEQTVAVGAPDEAEKWRWRLRHDSGEVIADGGQGYSSKQKAKQGMEVSRQTQLVLRPKQRSSAALLATRL